MLEVELGEIDPRGNPFPRERQDAQVYVWPGDGPALAPEGWYLDYLLEGAREHRLPEAYIRRIVAHRERQQVAEERC